MNEIAATYLETYARGAVVEGGWTYAKALLQARLDYSEHSLARLDKLLTQIRERARPAAEDLDTVAGRNFVALVAFYVIELARRRTQASVDWHERGVAQRVLPAGAQLPGDDGGRLVAWAPDQRAAFFPLAWVQAQVLGEGVRRGPADYVAGVVAHLERHGPPIWLAGMEALGRLASWQMMMAADGGCVLPTMLDAGRPHTWVTLGGGLPGDDLRGAVERGGRRLEDNPEGAAWQALAYDGIADFAGGRSQAVMVILVVYGDVPLRVKVAFPYRPAAAGRRFAILDPALREASVGDDAMPPLAAAMQRGIASVKWAFGLTWEELRQRGLAAGADGAPAGEGSSASLAAAASKPAGRTRPAWKFW
jgi:hypothetical protein